MNSMRCRLMQKINIIIPCYNEENRIDEAKLAVLAMQPEVYVYLANDGSKDGTLSRITQFSEKHPDNCFVLDYKENQGKAMTIYKSVNHLLQL
ncbi:MAG: glycosyltransferase, partial [Moraxellaceae bacterium]